MNISTYNKLVKMFRMGKWNIKNAIGQVCPMCRMPLYYNITFNEFYCPTCNIVKRR